jgi:hypothetical protein
LREIILDMVALKQTQRSTRYFGEIIGCSGSRYMQNTQFISPICLSSPVENQVAVRESPFVHYF